MARGLQDIISELDAVYRPQKDLYAKQAQELDPQLTSELQGLEAQRTDAFDTIRTGANRRGLFFSGIPLEEQARYTGGQFLPAVANLRSKYASQRFGLQDAIAKITQDQYLKAQDIYQTELDREAAERAAAASRASGGGGGWDPTTSSGETTPTAQTIVAGFDNVNDARASYGDVLRILEERLSKGEKINISSELRALYGAYGKFFKPQDITKEVNNLFAKYQRGPRDPYVAARQTAQKYGGQLAGGAGLINPGLGLPGAIASGASQAGGFKNIYQNIKKAF